jgi:dCMP deaminase
MYVGLFPCNECAKMIIQSGIREVVFMSDKYASEPSNIASRRMFDLSGVRYRKHAPVTEKITLQLGCK